VLATVSSEQFVNHATQTSQGTKMPRANWDVLVRYPLPIPPPELLSIFDKLMRDITGQLINFIFRNRNLRETRDILLPVLFGSNIGSWRNFHE